MTAIRPDPELAAADLSLVQSRRVAVIGDYPGLGHAHALNLRDCGVEVLVGLPADDPGGPAAADEGLPVLTPGAAAAESDLVMVLAPDTEFRSRFHDDIAANLDEGDALFVRRCFNIRFGLVDPPSTVDVALVAPVGSGELVRRQFVDGKGVPCLVAVHADATGDAWPLALSYTKAIGGTRAGVIRTTFAEETGAGLFGEQAMLGGLTALVQAGFEVLTEAGCQPELAYLACLHELESAIRHVHEGGLAGLFESVPDTATYGALTRGQRVVPPAVRDELRRILGEINDGTFAREWLAEDEAGRPTLRKLGGEATDHQIEQAGRRIRDLMPWLG